MDHYLEEHPEDKNTWFRFNFCFEQNTNILKKNHYKSKESFKLKKQNKNTLV